MPYGPEVDDDERKNGTAHDRGLHVVIYQSSIERGFRHIQTGQSSHTLDFPWHSYPLSQHGTMSRSSRQENPLCRAGTPCSAKRATPTSIAS